MKRASLVLTMTCACLTPAFAQEPGTEAGGSREIEEIVVTATKREENVRDIAGTVNAVPGELLEQQGSQEMADFLKLVPGVMQNSIGSSENKITIRGVGTETSSTFTNPTAGILIGNAPYTAGQNTVGVPDLSPFDLAGVEILKGPVGTLFGAAGLSGAIRYVPQKALLGEWQAKGFGQYTSIREGEPTYAGGVALNAPVWRDQLAVRFVALRRRVGGLYDDTHTGREDIDPLDLDMFRGMLEAELFERFHVTAMHLDQRMDQPDTGFADNVDGHLERRNVFAKQYRHADVRLTSFDLEYEFDGANLVSSTSRIENPSANFVDVARHQGIEALGLPLPLFLDQRVVGWHQEFRLVSANGESPWKWIIGLYFSEANGKAKTIGIPLTADVPIVPEINALEIDYDQDHSEHALFGEMTRTLFDRLDLTFGMRVYRNVVDGVVVSQGALISAECQCDRLVNDAKIEESGINPKGSIKYALTDETSVYATISRGFRFGGINLTGGATPDVPVTFKSDSLWNYEGGVRSEWLDGSLRADVTGYYVDWTDPQIQQFTDDSLFTYVDNVGGAKVKGAELALSWLPPLDGLNLSSAVAWNVAETTESFRSDADPAQTVPEGTRLPGSGEWQTATTAHYDRELLGVAVGGSVIHTYVSEGFNNLGHSRRILGFQTWDLQLRTALPEFLGAPKLAFTVSNLANERGVANALTVADASSTDVFYIRPRAFDLRLELLF